LLEDSATWWRPTTCFRHNTWAGGSIDPPNTHCMPSLERSTIDGTREPLARWPAFDNVSHKRLLHNLRKRKVDEKTIRWIASFLSDRYMHIMVDGFQSELYAINTGIPQGSPLSPILYLFYNADLIEQCNEATDAMSTGYIDNVAILAWGDTTQRTCQILSTILEKAQQWASTHVSVFALDKFQLTHFTRTRKSIDTDAPILTEWGEIKPATTCKYLGLTMDTKLKWMEHVEIIKQKATRTVHTLSSLGSSTWGIRLQDMCKLYEAITLPQMMYACSIWSNANLHDGKRTYTYKTIDALRSIQARAARSICGAYKATSTAALDVEAFLLPVEQQIWRQNADFITRLSSSREIAKTAGFELNEPAPVVAKKNRRPRRSPWQKIDEELRSKQVRDLDKQEPIPVFITPPWRRGPSTHIDNNADRARDHHDRGCATEPSTANRTGVCRRKRHTERHSHIHRQPGRYMVHRQGRGKIGSIYPPENRATGPGSPGQRIIGDCPLDTCPRGHPRK
jgi:hypothetical protein